MIWSTNLWAEPLSKAKPFCISKRKVWEAYKRVKANNGTAGVDDVSMEEFGKDLKKTFTSSGIGCHQVVIFHRLCEE